ncbi:MAG TPA: FAD:protein FMN transferase [Polyangiaceae bacterium]|nr:FAD:protein FMN transferase [Polyangiaceae bacterium]
MGLRGAVRYRSHRWPDNVLARKKSNRGMGKVVGPTGAPRLVSCGRGPVAVARSPLRSAAVTLLAASWLVACHRDRDRDREQEHSSTPTATVFDGPAPPIAEISARGTVAPLPRTKVSVEASAMGTRLDFVAFTSAQVDEARTRAVIDRAVAEIRRLEALMTTWRDDSEIAHINRNAGKAPVKVGVETARVIDESLWISEKSGGVFDITFEAMHGLWRFDQDVDPHPPRAEEVAERRKLIDYRHIVRDKNEQTVFLDKAGVKISLGGIAKGFAIDRAAAVLIAEGVQDFLAQAGGDLFVHGRKPDGSPWIAGVRDPRGEAGTYFAEMPVTDHAFSTAGDYERSYIVGGRRYHHIIDPRSGYPATASRSVTIWAKDALTADALDDAVFILGPKQGLELVESIDDAGAIIVDADNRVWISRRLEGKVRVERPPTDGV